MFSYYAAIVKNLRGVVIFDPEASGSWDKVKWLVKKFRYRNLGLPPVIVEKYREKLSKYLGGSPFIELAYPIAEVKILPAVMKEHGVPDELAEALVLASVYISPLLVIGEKYVKLLEQYSIDKVLVCRELNDNEWKLHLRIADYSILDMYKERVFEILNAIENNMLNQELLRNISEKRRDDVAKDKKRYWRITCDHGKPFILYIDMIDVVAKTIGVEKFIELIRNKKELAAGLSVVPAVNLG
ncbi:hypothetical protein J4526_06245 [Desulfurococcaceae archaeon MEX13E-LK6-19]|nr:hypothetical protein J4526_06245 [Desulfurococcaceae archaeon MEX13E-LK6-19]